MYQLKDGIVFLEILKQYLINQGISKKEININSNLNNEERLKLVLCSLIDLAYDDEYKKQAEYFYTNKHKIYVKENMMINFILFFKDMYENVNFGTAAVTTSNNNTIETKYEQKDSIFLTQNSSDSDNEGNEVSKKFNNLQIEEIQKESFVNKNDFSILDNNDNKFTIISQNNNNKGFSPQSEQKHIELSLSNSATFSISPKEKLNKNYSNTNIIKNKIKIPNTTKAQKYPTLTSPRMNISKKRKAEIQQTTGIYSLSSAKNPKLEKFYSSMQQPISLIKFYHPTSPIIDVTLTSCSKYLTKITTEIPKKIIINNTKQNPSINKQDELPIKKWLINLKIIKKMYLTSNIITICKNGVVFCDIINRCEARNDVIKGIIRSPFTKAQIKININKAVEYIRQMKLLYPYIKDIYSSLEEELINENDYVIYSLINGLYKYYNHIRRQNSTILSQKKEKTIPKIDIGGIKKTMNFNSDDLNNFCYSNSSNRNQIRSSYGSSSTNNIYSQKMNQRHLISSNTNLNDNSTLFLNGSSSINYNNNANNDNIYFQQLLSQNLSNQQSPLTQISLISNIPNQKQVSHSPSNSSIILSQTNNNSIVDCLEIEEENTCTKSQNFTLAKKKSNSKSIIRNMKPEKEKKEKGINCFLLFNKSNLSKMKKDLLKKEELIKSQENN